MGDHITGPTYYNTGMKFGLFDPNDVQESVWGTATVTFFSCNEAELAYSSTVDGYGDGFITMERLGSVSGSKCSNDSFQGNFSTVVSQQVNSSVGTAIAPEGGLSYIYSPTSSGYEVIFVSTHSQEGQSFEFFADRYSSQGGVVMDPGTGTMSDDGWTLDFSSGGQARGIPLASFQKDLNTAMMAGSYNIRDKHSGLIGALTIQGDGSVNGTVSNGCALEGTIFIPDTKFNQAILDPLYATQQSQSSPCGFSANLSGLMSLNHDDDTIHFIGNDYSTAHAWTLEPFAPGNGESVVGAWTATNSASELLAVALFEDGTYVHVEYDASSPLAENGMEWGNYILDTANGRIITTQSFDSNSDVGLSDFVAGSNPPFLYASADANKLTIGIDEDGNTFIDDTINFNRQSSNNIVGTWTSTETTDDLLLVSFAEDGTYVEAEVGSDGNEDLNGMEYGSWSRDAGTGQMTFSVTFDENGSTGGLSDVAAGDVHMYINVAGDVLTAGYDEDRNGSVDFSVVFNRQFQ